IRVEGLRQQQGQLQQTVAAMILSGQLREKEQQLEQLKHLDQLANELKKSQMQLGNDKQLGQELSQLQGQQTKTTRTLELAWHRGQAAILADELEANLPCPVCGSLDHPAPAGSEVALPRYQDLEAARLQLQKTTTKLEAARDKYRESGQNLVQLQARYAELQQPLSDNSGSITDLETGLRELQQQWQRDGSAGIDTLTTEELVEILNRHQRELSVLETETKLIEEQLPDGYRQLKVLEQREVELRQQLADLVKQLDVISEAQQQAFGELERVSATLQEVIRQLDILQQQQQDADIAVVRALELSPFDDYDHYLQMVMSETERTILEKSLEEFNSRQLKLSGAQEQLQLSLKGKHRPNLHQLEAELNQISEEKQQAERNWNELDSRQKILLETRKKLRQNIQQLEKLDSRYAVIGTLSDVANGQTGQKISLQRFVLSVLLDEVLLEASQRFSQMS
ncbi:MAG: hypothetical protein KAG92_07685, partial [Deltaproteobacteria bacterium]|nr:hypothetical protein [Deltaproteobacteria bacterium]